MPKDKLTNWDMVRLGDVVMLTSGQTKPLVSGDIPVYGGNGITGYVNKSNVNSPCILIGRVGANCGNVFYTTTDIWVTDNALLTKFISPKYNILFLYYYFKYSDLSLYKIGSAQPVITQGSLNNINIPLPPFLEQESIALTLSCLDDKIELNAQMNKTLEEMAQAIFKSWFVDFDPFKDGEFEDSELGKIPKGWKVGTLGELVHSTLGGDWGKEVLTDNYSQEVYCIRGADIPEIVKGNKGKMPTRYILPKNYLAKKLEPSNIVVEISGGSPTQSTGRVAYISKSLLLRYDKGMVCTNFCRAITPIENYSYFIYYYWTYLYEKGVMFLYENGTTGIKNFDLNSFLNREEIIIPKGEILNKFNEAMLSVFEIIFTNGLQTEQLKKLRDYLLPKLMSGEIRIPLEKK